jgi:hypothetical protein
MKIKLPILFNTDSLQILDNADIDFDLRECEVRPIVFYQISAITSYIENEIEYSQIYSNGTSFYCSLKMNEVERMIEQSQLISIQ